ncbi:sulfurtransferase TusA family protein [Fuchsiella alkaliacetigena]|uniref:sulfurtransferase TusA family protein n=1 Tax=Fuchsiella alkaliacetigena TaxID=957042 RepID=UPI002009E3D7|nr:sulfurtransferase TusA family protein [Fuchsiella alkaliacetigena]MCK8824418.1 sulfurtransferase TusA family protein [Fuchsiella alkaliacetigena]
MNNQPVFEIPETVKEDTEKYEGEVERFLAGEIDAVRFKSYRVPMGVYSQRGAAEKKYMVRVRAPGGVITKEQLEVLNELAAEYGSGYLHFTTRQDVQIHAVEMEDTPEILNKLLEVGLSPRGGGGNTVRNVANASRAGVNPEEVFDTTPHALALTEYLIKSRSSFNLPRKYKIAFSSTAADEGLATVNDLGFIAKEVDGERGFKVYAAGGMGNGAAVAILLEEFILEEEIFHVAEAIKRFFDDYGDRSNKHRARLRFVRKRLGEEEFIAKYQQYLAEVLEEGIETEEIKYFQIEREEVVEPEEVNLSADYIYPEKEIGYYSVELRPENGDFKYAEFKELLAKLPDNISYRTTNRQSLLLRGIKDQQLESLIGEIKGVNGEFLAANVATTPIACKGASTCNLGLCLSPNLASEIRKELSALAAEKEAALPQIYISGCPNCCGQHIIGKIGFEGRAKRVDGKLVPHYALLLGGRVAEDKSRYGEKLIDLPARRIPKFLVALAEQLAEDESYEPTKFNQYLEEQGLDRIEALAKEFTDIPAYAEEPEIYRDWGQEEDFSLAGRGAGECGAGVMDIIELDLNTARDNYQEAIEDEADDLLYQAIVNAARALLIIKGIDTQKDRVIIEEFKAEFIDSGLVAEENRELLNSALDYQLGDVDNLLTWQDQVEKLIERVEKLFSSLNSKLEFDLPEEELKAGKSVKDEVAESTDVADLRGVECPMNFVKAKVAIAPLESGASLEIYLDEGEPIANVPQSLAEEGHQILSKEQTEEGYYILKVEKA